jgi:hypothetical protein
MYQLDALEKLILTEFSPGNTQAQLAKEKFRKATETFTDEIERVKKALIHEVFTFDDDKRIELYIQQHQRLLIQLTDQLLNYFPEHERQSINITADFSRINLYRAFYVRVEELLSFIEKHFSRYFDLSAKIPDSYRYIAAHTFQIRIPKLKEELLARNLSEALVSFLAEPFTEFVQHKEVGVSFKRLIFLKELYKEIENLVRSELIEEELHKRMCASMLYINYNSLKFFNHCARKIKESYHAKETLNEQLEKLSHYLKIINQQHEKPGFAYKQNHNSLKEQLSEWVTEEIAFLEKKQQLSLPFKGERTTNDFAEKEFKIHLDSSVPRVAYFVKILVETRLIKNQNVLDVIRFFSTYISTGRASNVSAESFRTKFYNTEDSAKKAVESNIMMLLNHIRKSK